MSSSRPVPPRQLRVTTWRHDGGRVVVVTEPSPLGGPAEQTCLRTTSVDEAADFVRTWLEREDVT